MKDWLDSFGNGAAVGGSLFADTFVPEAFYEPRTCIFRPRTPSDPHPVPARHMLQIVGEAKNAKFVSRKLGDPKVRAQLEAAKARTLETPEALRRKHQELLTALEDVDELLVTAKTRADSDIAEAPALFRIRRERARLVQQLKASEVRVADIADIADLFADKPGYD